MDVVVVGDVVTVDVVGAQKNKNIVDKVYAKDA